MNPVRVLPVEVVRAGHHAIPVEVLSTHHSLLSIAGTLTLGDLIVGLGTLLLAAFTWKLARATYALDKSSAARERERHEQRARGVARLVLGELDVVEASLEQALAKNQWRWTYPLPRVAWDRDGTLIAETLLKTDAEALIALYIRLGAWESTVVWGRENFPEAESLTIASDYERLLVELLDLTSDAKRYLRELAYPDA
jgi:hypothetical protein